MVSSCFLNKDPINVIKKTIKNPFQFSFFINLIIIFKFKLG